ncbi:MAG: FAD-dependent oxidoreductase [Gemmatimonadetes bacterium]|nr:FAD-dependent oxidoreductase [Gemmatimonadota bacterium]
MPRAPTRLRFLDGDRLAPGTNLGALLRQLDWFEAAWHLPRLPFSSKAGRSIAEYYGALVGAGNYARALGPMLSAVPSQSADAMPADMLFKSRASRRTDLPRSFTLDGGLHAAAGLLAAEPGLEVRTGAEAVAIEPDEAGRARVRLASGETIVASTVALATPPSTSARLLGSIAPDAARAAARVREAGVDSMAVVLPASRVSWPVTMFAVPKRDILYSVVTRDSVPDPASRAFTVHFAPGHPRETRLTRMARLLGVPVAELGPVWERHAILPSPEVGHERIVRDLDAAIAGRPLAVVGNWFDGLAIEDCVQRAGREWARVRAIARPAR